MVRKTKTMADVIREAKDYLKNSGAKTLRPRGHSIVETVKEGAAFLEQTQRINERNKKLPRREIIRKPIEIKKKIHKVESSKIEKPKTPVQVRKEQPKAPVAKPENEKKPEAKAKSVERAPQKQPKEQSKSPQPKPVSAQKVASKSTEKKQEQQKKAPVEKPQEKPTVEKEQEKSKKPTPAVAKTQEQPKKDQPSKYKKEKVVPLKVPEHPKPSPKKVQKQSKVQGKQVQEKPSAPEPKQPGMKEPPVSLEESANVPQKRVKKQKPVKQEEQPQIVQTDLVKEEEKQDLKVGPRRTDTQLSRDPGHPAAGIIDVVFVVDTTGSMDAYLEKTKDTVQVLVSRIKEYTKEHDISVRFGFVAYRDHPPQELTYVTQMQDLCTNIEVLKFIAGLDCRGGGDGAEAVLDGINEAATKISWRQDHKIPSLRYIFHICDQPPHGREYGGYSELWDNGCVCGLKLEEVAHKVNIREIHYRLIKASATRLELMAALFKDKFSNYEDTTLELVQGEAKEMDIRISDMVIRELLPDYDYE